MKKYFLIFLFILIIYTPISAENRYLCEVNGKKFSEHQFKIWWNYWKSKDTPFPNTPQPFIDWILLSEEANSLGLNEESSYKKKLRIFREVRSLLQLRFEEVEKKININPDKLWQFYKKIMPLFIK